MRKRKFTEEQEKEIVRLYEEENLSSNEIGRRFNTPQPTVYYTLKRNGATLRKQTSVRQYEVNDHFFDIIDTEEKAYFLGILLADGNVRSDHPEISLGLQEEDKPLLEKLNRFVHPERPLLYLNRDIKYPNWKNQWKLYISSQYMKDTVAKYGLIPKKSLIKTFPQVILDSNEDIIRHFIRGYFDGNGSIGIYPSGDSGSVKFTFCITSTESMCKSLQDVFQIILDIQSSIKPHTKVFNVIIYDQIMIFKIMKWFYKDATIYMNRKHEIYENALKIKYKKLIIPNY